MGLEVPPRNELRNCDVDVVIWLLRKGHTGCSLPAAPQFSRQGFWDSSLVHWISLRVPRSLPLICSMPPIPHLSMPHDSHAGCAMHTVVSCRKPDCLLARVLEGMRDGNSRPQFGIKRVKWSTVTATRSTEHQETQVVNRGGCSPQNALRARHCGFIGGIKIPGSLVGEWTSVRKRPFTGA